MARSRAKSKQVRTTWPAVEPIVRPIDLEGWARGPWIVEEERWWSCRGCRQTFCSKGWLADFEGMTRYCHHNGQLAYERPPFRKYLGEIVEDEET